MKKDYKLKDTFARFSTEKDALKCFRLLSELSNLTFCNQGYGVGINDKKKNIVWIREIKPLELKEQKKK